MLHVGLNPTNVLSVAVVVLGEGERTVSKLM